MPYSGVAAGDSPNERLTKADRQLRKEMNEMPATSMKERTPEEIMAGKEKVKEHHPTPLSAKASLSATGGEGVKGAVYNHPHLLSDEALSKEYNESFLTMVKPERALTERQKSVRNEFEERFSTERKQRSIEFISDAARLVNPAGDLLIVGVGKATGQKLRADGLIEIDLTGTRLSIGGKKLDKGVGNKTQSMTAGKTVKSTGGDLAVTGGIGGDKLEFTKTKPTTTPALSQRLDALDIARTDKAEVGWRPNYKTYSKQVEWTAPTGTQQTYKIYQRNDIDWNKVRVKGPKEFRGMTNREAGLKGCRPELIDGSFATIHHIGQNAQGPLAEASTKIHDFKNKKAFKALHNQFEGKKHPENPVNHSIWDKEQRAYWKWRSKNDK